MCIKSGSYYRTEGYIYQMANEGYIYQMKTSQSYIYGESHNASSLYLDKYGTAGGVGASDGE